MGMMGDMGWMTGPGWMTGAMWVSLLAGLSVLALATIVIVAGVRWLVTPSASPAASDRPDPALALLRERYSRGEIGLDEFQRMRQDLS